MSMLDTLINLTPHSIVIQTPDGTQHTIQPSGQVARVNAVNSYFSRLDDVPVYRPMRGDVVGLPDQTDGVNYLVSGMVLSAIADRKRWDVFAPATGPDDGAIRNTAGQIVAVTRLHSAP